ncbi:hypothetical protein RTM1035_13578 [Roseovarius sp. TM1035]|jgi:hypothetical protein|nr:hypothetical protein RTM1035_13578 [Roseovarius sp. TM1035]MBW4973608.1 lytic transglycosylase domain-containing protein [Roseovarius mucosus]
MRGFLIVVFIVFFSLPAAAQDGKTADLTLSPPARDGNIPRTRWEHRTEAELWTRSALSALKAHGAPLVRSVPRDIASWCPSYATGGEARRRAFWVGFLSALAKHESTHNPKAVGGGGQWHGLLQIGPATARGYKCRAGSGEALRHGPDNLSCAIRIMAHTVPRDGVVSEGRRGVAADWGPLHSATKREDMQRWTRAQSYCKPLSAVRPRARPTRVARVAE